MRQVREFVINPIYCKGSCWPVRRWRTSPRKLQNAVTLPISIKVWHCQQLYWRVFSLFYNLSCFWQELQILEQSAFFEKNTLQWIGLIKSPHFLSDLYMRWLFMQSFMKIQQNKCEDCLLMANFWACLFFFLRLYVLFCDSLV